MEPDFWLPTHQGEERGMVGVGVGKIGPEVVVKQVKKEMASI